MTRRPAAATQANAARFTSGFGAVILNVLMTKMVTDLFSGRERLLAMSALIKALSIGIGISLAVMGPLGEFAGRPWALASSALFAMMGLVIVAAFYRPSARTGFASCRRFCRRFWLAGVAHAGLARAVDTVIFVISVQAGGFLLERSAHPEGLCHAAIVAWYASLLFIAGRS